MQVGIRELKNGLSRYIAQVRGGQEVIVTDRGTAVARLIPIDRRRALDELIAEGLVEPALPQEAQGAPVPTVKLSGDGPTMAEYVSQQRC